MEKKLVIVIMDSRLKNSLRETISTLVVLIAPITLGIAMQSTAMQWVGFVLGFMAVFSYANRIVSENTRHTITEARQLLDALEKAGEE